MDVISGEPVVHTKEMGGETFKPSVEMLRQTGLRPRWPEKTGISLGLLVGAVILCGMKFWSVCAGMRRFRRRKRQKGK